MDKKKIAIITSGYFPIPPVKGGAIETLVNIIYEENERQDELELVVYSIYDVDAKSKSKSKKNNRIIYVKVPKYIEALDHILYFVAKNILRKKKHMSYRYIVQRLYYVNSVSKSISKHDYDCLIIENHPTLLGVLKNNRNKEKYKDKYYYHAHNEILRTFGYDELLTSAKGYICVSQYIANTILGKFRHYDGEMKVLRNRVDEAKFRGIDENKLTEFKKKYSIPDGYLLFTFTGRLNPEKGVKELLEAFKIAHPKNSKLVVAGSYYFGSGIKSEYEEALKRLSEDIKGDIIFTGYIDYDDMPCMYAVSDVIILPSIWNDPAPLTVIESLTCGKPLITTNSGGIPEYASERNSIIINIDNKLIENLSNAIIKLSEDPVRRNELVREAQKDSNSWKKEDYYKEFLSLV